MDTPENIDKNKLAEAAMAILSLGFHGDKFGTKTWKGFDWELMNLLHEKGWIDNPKSKAKSVGVTKEGEEKSQEFLQKYFGKEES